MLPKNRPLNDLEMQKFIKTLEIKHFRGVFMRDRLPKKPFINECAVVNLDSIYGSGTHWVAYCKKKNDVYYYDSFGNLPPPHKSWVNISAAIPIYIIIILDIKIITHLYVVNCV